MAATAKGQPNGLATLDNAGKLTAAQAPAGGGGLDPSDISATAPATWDSGTSTMGVAVGTGAGTVCAGNDSRLTAGAAGTATVRALGTAATTACAGNDARLLTGSATAVNNAATFADLAAATTAYNALLTALRNRGVITGS